MSSSWVVNQIRAANTTWDPRFSMRSAFHWIRALDFEITSTHGLLPQQKYDSAKQSFITAGIRARTTPPASAWVFEPLLHSLTYSIALASIRTRSGAYWAIPSSIVSWYYSFYFAMHSILYADQSSSFKTHKATAKAYRSVRANMPHPLNMVSTLSSAVPSYSPTLPTFPSASSYNLKDPFSRSSTVSRGMLLQYLKGTTDWHVDEVKGEMKRNDRSITSFRSNADKQKLHVELNVRFPEVNFLHCALRYRGKANYRDGAYLTIGNGDNYSCDAFLECLNTTSSFAFLCALAYCSVRLGTGLVSTFLNDLGNLRGRNAMNSDESFWQGLTV